MCVGFSTLSNWSRVSLLHSTVSIHGLCAHTLYVKPLWLCFRTVVTKGKSLHLGKSQDFPGGAGGWESACQWEVQGSPRLIPGQEDPLGRKWPARSSILALENPGQRGAWQAAVRWSRKSQAWLNDAEQPPPSHPCTQAKSERHSVCYAPTVLQTEDTVVKFLSV